MSEHAADNDLSGDGLCIILPQGLQLSDSCENLILFVPVVPIDEEPMPLPINDNSVSLMTPDLGITVDTPEINYSAVSLEPDTSHEVSPLIPELNNIPIVISIEPVPELEIQGAQFTVVSQPAESTPGSSQSSPNSEQKHMLNRKCLCEYCFTGLLNLKFSFSYFTQLVYENCKMCGYLSRMQVYQDLCFACSRRKNLCMKCMMFSVVTDAKNVFHFETLLTGKAEEVFNKLNNDFQNKIIRKVYITYDAFAKKEDCLHYAETIFRNLLQKYN